MIIREATLKDSEDISFICNQYVAEATMNLTRRSAQYYSDLIRNLPPREKIYVGVYLDRVIAVGFIKAYSPKEGYRHACETSVFLDSTYLRRGFGSQMKVYIIDACKRLNYRHLVAKIWLDNKASIEYNLHLGYTIVGIQQKIGFVNGKWIDIVIMQYLVEPENED